MNRSGLKKVTKTVRSKRGSVRRSYWVKAQESVKSAGQKIWRNKGKLALAGAVIAGGLYLRHKKTQSLKSILKDKEDMIKADLAAKRGAEEWIKKQENPFDRIEARKSLRAAKLDPTRPPQQTPSFNRAHAAHYTGPPKPPFDPRNRTHQLVIDQKAKSDRQYGNTSKGAPLELGPGSNYKPKRSRRKK